MLSRALVAIVVIPALVAAAAWTASADPGPPRGPAFGNNRFRTAIGPHRSDTDDYAAPLVRGESLSVVVRAAARSDLRPRLTVIDPDGADRTPDAAAPADARSAALRSFAIDKSGTWVVRVGPRDEPSGAPSAVPYEPASEAYTARFEVEPARPVVARKRRLRPGALEGEHVVEAVDGSSLDVSLRVAKGRATLPTVTLAGPAGDPVALTAPKRKGGVLTWTRVPLLAGDGAYRVSVGIDEGAVTYDLRLVARPPKRPRGTTDLSPVEPRLGVHATPERIGAGEPYVIHGTGFSAGRPPRVWFGGAPATVFSVQSLGTKLSVFPPVLQEDTVADVTVENPDGQVATARAHVVYVTSVPPVVSRLEPGLASVYTGGLIRYRLTLASPAPASGATVLLAAEDGLGTLPASVAVPARAQAAQFDFVASSGAAAGRVFAKVGDVWRSATVSVVALPVPDGGGDPGETVPPPALLDEIDVSKWVVRQQNSSRDFTIPAGTKLLQGGYVVIGRAASQSAFETYWGVTLGSDVRYFNGDGSPASNSDDWPSINGGETFELRDALGRTVDGPTPAMSATAGENWRRTPGAPAGLAASWTVTTSLAPGGSPTPGRGQPTTPGRHGVHISEFTDTPSGSSPYEFVELFFDGHP